MMALDPDRTLALAYVPAPHREAVRALWTLDSAFGAVLASGREPALRQIKLAWWREALERLDTAPAPAEPVLRALEAHVLPYGITGAALSELEEGWSALLAETLDDGALTRYAAGRGGILFRLTAAILGGTVAPNLGEGWALASLARNSSRAEERKAALAAACERLREGPKGIPRPLRPLTMLAKLARRDASRGLPFEVHGAPKRMAVMAAHRLTGR